jgi:gas vesicle protein
MGIFDKAKDLANEHNQQVDQAVDKMADLVDEKTGGQHADKVDQAAQQVKDGIDDVSGHPRG